MAPKNKFTREEMVNAVLQVVRSICKAIKEIPGFTDAAFDADEKFRVLTEK